MQVDYNTYKQNDFACRECGWKGKGAELLNGEFNESSAIAELECPECMNTIAFWQAPLKDNNDDV